jgi:hypothetical protein
MTASPRAATGPALLALFALLAHPQPAGSQGRPDFDALMAAQRAALRPLTGMDGTWRGRARILEPDGTWLELTQTERVGPMLDSTVKVIEGRGYDASGKTVFNAFAVLAWDGGRKAFAFRSYARGLMGDYAFTPTDSGFVWEIPAGPMTIRYTASVRDGKWREVGDRIAPGQPPVRFIEMDLVRVGGSDWPAGGAVPPR